MHCSRGLVLDVLVLGVLGVGKTPPPGNLSTWVVDFGERAIVVAHGQREMGRTGYSTPTGQRGMTCTMCMASMARMAWRQGWDQSRGTV
jgi:hypothetical protein